MATKTKQRATIGAQAAVAEKIKEKVTVELHALDIDIIQTDRLKPNKYNPNKMEDREFEVLRASIRAEGLTLPILVNKDLTIIDGEHRWRAALAEQIEIVPVVMLDLDDARARMSTIRHNRATGTHDADLEAMVLADLEKLAGADFIAKELRIDHKTLTSILEFTTAPDLLGQEEFGPSWKPVSSAEAYTADEDGKPVNLPTFTGRHTIDGATNLRSATENANTLAFLKVKGLDEDAKTQSLYTVTAVLDPAEATTVAVVLEKSNIAGKTPAERLLTLAKEALNGR